MELHRAAMDRVVRSAARKIQAWKIEESVSGEERRGDRALNAFQLERERDEGTDEFVSPPRHHLAPPTLPHVTPSPGFNPKGGSRG
jgi:hypothetical protein